MTNEKLDLQTVTSGRHYVIATDGSAINNPGPGGWGLVKQLKAGDEVLRQLADAGSAVDTLDELVTTNIRMELFAAIKAVEGIKEVDTPTIILCDCGHVVDGNNGHKSVWKERGWRSSDNKPVKNLDLWQRLDTACIGKTIYWVKVKGHAGHDLNEMANTLAQGAAKGCYPKGRKSVKTRHPTWFVGG